MNILSLVMSDFSLLEYRYLQDAVDLLRSRHARVIVASQTPDNPYAIFTIPVYVQYAADIAIANHLPYIDHFRLLLVTYYALGADKTNDLFPLDQHVHTSPEGQSSILPWRVYIEPDAMAS